MNKLLTCIEIIFERLPPPDHKWRRSTLSRVCVVHFAKTEDHSRSQSCTIRDPPYDLRDKGDSTLTTRFQSKTKETGHNAC